MEAGQTPPPPPPPGQTPPPPPPGAAPQQPGAAPPPPPGAAPGAPPPSGKPGAGARVLVVIVALLFAFAGAVMIAVSLDLAEGPRCEQVLAGEEPPDEEGECLDASKNAQTISVVLTFLSGIAAAVVLLAGIFFAVTGRGGRLVAIAAGAAIVLGAIGLLVG
jgi:hypothetical protein